QHCWGESPYEVTDTRCARVPVYLLAGRSVARYSPGRRLQSMQGVEARIKVGLKFLRILSGEPPKDVDGFLDGVPRGLALADRAQPATQVVQAPGEVEEERVGVLGRKRAVDRDRLAGGIQGGLALADLAQPDAQVGQARREVGEERVGVLGRERPVRVD